MAPAFPIVYSGQKESHNFSQKNSTTMVGKSRKLSVGHPQRLVTDYQHEVDTMAESEGLGSYTEMTLSEESCSPKRKCISLNGDNNDRFGVPVNVLSFSKMSRSERRDLKLRLRSELEKVRMVQQRFASFSTNTVILSPSSDIRSCSDGLNRLPLEGTPKLSEHPSQGKKRLPPAGNGPRANKGFLRHVENPKQAAPSTNTMLMKQCENLLSRLMSHQFGWVFNTPVDVVKLNIPDYFTVIKHPMDLGTIKSKLARGEYSSPADFAVDVRLTFSNAMTYNPPGNNVHIMAQTLSKHFEQRWKVIEKKIPTNSDSHLLPLRKDSQVHKPAVSDHIIPSSRKKKLLPMGHMGKLEPVKKVMTTEEKHKLSTELEDLLGELPESVIDFLKENSSGAGQTSEDEIEIDIDALSDDVLFKLRKLLDDFMLEKKQQAKGEQCEMELHHESGFSNSSIPPGKGNDPLDEDVDIGGNDQPVSSIPPVEIERDTTHKESGCSGPSSSSSDDSSSSSDSDSRSSHSSEPEVKKAVQQGHKLQGTANAEHNSEENRGDVDQDIGTKQSGNTFIYVEENPQCNPLAVEVDDPKEGERAPPPESQVSSDKLYRAALLKSRFADTIFKAQEKTLDPEKLRLEREELEKRRREEKARLLAEAKAAEEACRKAEAEAAAEAKRKRELEREAARLALQKMEKTVDINENCQFMEDLEMLKAAPDDNLLTFMDDNDAAADDSPDARLGSFRLRGNSNPLEQLGLFMKDDDEEEEEVDVPHSGPKPDSNDVEEGEID